MLHPRGNGWVCFNRSDIVEGFCLDDILLNTDIVGVPWEEFILVPHCANVTTRERYNRDRDLRIKYLDRFHTTSHATREEALDCYAEFMSIFGADELTEILAGGFAQ